jgi:hypothetical protein
LVYSHLKTCRKMIPPDKQFALDLVQAGVCFLCAGTALFNVCSRKTRLPKKATNFDKIMNSKVVEGAITCVMAPLGLYQVIDTFIHRQQQAVPSSWWPFSNS